MPALLTDATNNESVIRPDDWKECVNLLSDAATAYAHLARVAAFMSEPGALPGKGNKFSKDALVFSGKGTVLLRKRIERGVVDYNTLYVISCFLAADYYGHNFAAARSHGRMLGQLFPREDIPVDHNLLNRVLRLDAVLALTHLMRPSFDVEKWVPEVFKPYFQPLLRTLPEAISLKAMGSYLDASITEDQKLKDIFIKLRQALSLYLLSFSESAFAGFEYKFFIQNIVYVSLARLVNHYLDGEALWAEQAISDRVILGRAHLQSYISLAAILWVRHVAKGDNYNADGPVVDAEAMFQITFKENMTASEWMVQEDAASSNAQLWSLYVGAYLEQVAAARTASCDSADKEWFNVRLTRHAKAMGLITWGSVRLCLLQFLHADVLQPHGSIWFPRIMEAN